MFFDQIKPTCARARHGHSMHMEWRHFSGDPLLLQPVKRQGGRRAARSIEGCDSLCLRVIEQGEYIATNSRRRRLGHVERGARRDSRIRRVSAFRKDFKSSGGGKWL